MWFWPLFLVSSLSLLFLFSLSSFFFSKQKMQKMLKGRHVLITGGSSGIGRALALLTAQLGVKVTLVARNKAGLEATRQLLVQHGVDADHVDLVSLDVTMGFDLVKDALKNVEDRLGPIFLIATCAGAAIPKTFNDQSESDIRQMMELNYFGTVSVLKALLPSLKSREEGHILLVSSQAGLLGLYGYTSYAASKFALRGFAESLLMELKPYNIGVTVGCPPDTDTKGFEIEERSKPEATRLISQFAGNGVIAPEIVAESMLKDALRKVFLSSPGLDGFFATSIANAASDCGLGALLVQSLLLGPMRIISWVMIKCFDGIVNKCVREERKRERST